MVDHERVCCMCGDVGFADKLFRCCRCRFRFQHLYCSNYYNGSLELLSPSSSSRTTITKSMEICDWCQSEGTKNSSSSTTTKSFKRSSSMDHHHNRNNLHIRSEYTSSDRIKQHQDHHMINHNNAASSGERITPKNNNNNNSGGGVPSPRPSSHRRYKLLKDVMC